MQGANTAYYVLVLAVSNVYIGGAPSTDIMCPPAQCCCCRIYEGVKTWTIVFIILGSLGVVGRIGLAAWAGSFCTDENIDLAEALDRLEFCYGDEEWWADALAGEEPTPRY